jgi:hypothetical protein
VFGKRNEGFAIPLAGTPLAIHTGEISAAKGMQGLRAAVYAVAISPPNDVTPHLRST